MFVTRLKAQDLTIVGVSRPDPRPQGWQVWRNLRPCRGSTERRSKGPNACRKLSCEPLWTAGRGETLWLVHSPRPTNWGSRLEAGGAPFLSKAPATGRPQFLQLSRRVRERGPPFQAWWGEPGDARWAGSLPLLSPAARGHAALLRAPARPVLRGAPQQGGWLLCRSDGLGLHCVHGGLGTLPGHCLQGQGLLVPRGSSGRQRQAYRRESEL